MKIRNQKGFGHVGVIVLIILVAAVAFAGWWVWRNHKDDNPTSSTTSQAASTVQSSTPALAKTYTNKDGQFNLKYPADWKTGTSNGGFEELQAPSGAAVDIRVITTGGLEGCMFDGCSTLTYKSVEDTGQQALNVGSVGSEITYTKVPLNLVTLTETSNNKTDYYIALSADTEAKANINKPQANRGSDDFRDFLFTKANDNKSAYPLISVFAEQAGTDFNSTDAQTIKAVLKSLRYTQ